MSAATLLGVFFIPALFVAVERLSARKGAFLEPSSLERDESQARPIAAE
jgi:hypothetical protein